MSRCRKPAGYGRAPFFELVRVVHGSVGQKIGQLLGGLPVEVVAGALLLAGGLHQLLRRGGGQAVRRNGAQDDAA